MLRESRDRGDTSILHFDAFNRVAPSVIIVAGELGTSGETLGEVAARCTVEVPDLMRANPFIVDVDSIIPRGTRLLRFRVRMDDFKPVTSAVNLSTGSHEHVFEWMECMRREYSGVDGYVVWGFDGQED